MMQNSLSNATEAKTNLRVIEIDPQTDPRWEDLLNTLPHSQIYHHPAWLQVLEEAFGYRAAHLACEDANGQLQGILPLLYKQGVITGRQFSSLPRTPVAGPLASDRSAASLLLQAAVEQARGKSGVQLQIKMASGGLDRLVDGLVGGPWRETYILELPQRPELLHLGTSRNHARIKWAVNKATRLGVQVSPADTRQELRSWYELYLDTMRGVVVPPRPYHFFEILWERLRPLGLMSLLLARQSEGGQSKLLAGSLFLMFGQTIFYAFNARLREALSLRPNDALQWQAIHDACSKGFRYYDLGEVTRDNQTLAEFKSKWGTQTRWLYRYYYPAPREAEISMLETTSFTHQLTHAVWQRLPIQATVLLSNLAHRYF